jgi:hypothetical protein
MRKIGRHVGTFYRMTFRRAAVPVETLESEVRHLREIEQRGEAGETPFIAAVGVVAFLLPIFLVMLGLALAAYYLTA